MSTSKDQHPKGSHFPNRGKRSSKRNQKEQNRSNSNYIRTQSPNKFSSTLILPAICESQARNHVTTPPALFEDQYLPYQGDPDQFIRLDIYTMTGKVVNPSLTNKYSLIGTLNCAHLSQKSRPCVFLYFQLIPFGRNRPMRDAIMVYQYNLQNKSRVDLVLTLSGGHGPIPAALKLPSIKPSTPMINLGSTQSFSTVLRNQTINGCGSEQSSRSSLLLLCRRDADYYLVEVKLDHGECIDATAQYLGGPELSSDDLDVIIQAMDPPGPTFGIPNIHTLPNPDPQLNSINLNEPEDMLHNDLCQGLLDGLAVTDWDSFGIYDEAEPMEYPPDLDLNDRPYSALSTTVSIPEDLALEFGLPFGNTSNEANESSTKLQSVVQSTISSFVGKRLPDRPATAIILTRIKTHSSTDFHPLLITRIKSAPTNRRIPQYDVSMTTPVQQITAIPTINSPIQVAGVPYRKSDKNCIGSCRMPSRKDSCNPDSQINASPNLQQPVLLSFTTPKERASSSKHANITPQQTKYCHMSKCTKLLRPMLVAVGATKCRCGFHYCPKHRASNVHACTYDYRGHEQLRLNKENPKIRGKLPLI